MSRAPLTVRLDAPLPRQVAVGAGTALFVCGWCFCRSARIRALNFLLDGQPQAVGAFGMPRLDPFRGFHSGLGLPGLGLPAPGVAEDPGLFEDPLLLSYRSGFWGLVRVRPHADDPSERVLRLRAELVDGSLAGAELARFAAVPMLDAERPNVPRVPGTEPLVAICMATHNPPQDLLVRQLDSIRSQSHRAWLCLISDDCSTAQHHQALARAIDGDPRFVLSRAPHRLGFYHNFERALSMVPAEAEYVALSDQDDRWSPHKLSVLLDRLHGAVLVYSDARIVDRDGRTISETYWGQRRNNHTDLTSLLVANAVTGAASLFRKELLEYALPFPPAQFQHYHDHWLALSALALGGIAFVDRPLYHYVQHGGASLGHAAANHMTPVHERVRSLRTRSPRDRIRKWRMHYFVDVARLMQFATVLEMRCGSRMSAHNRRALRRFLRSEESLPALIGLFGRGARELLGRHETLGAEWMLFGALLWRRLLSATARQTPQRRFRLDAVPPADLAPGPDRGVAGEGTAARVVAEKMSPLQLRVCDEAPERINLLVPTIDLDHLFGGYIAKFNLARRLAERGHRVRIVTVDPVGPLPRSWRQKLESYSGLENLTKRVEFVFGRESPAIEVSFEDSFIATTWWTAHIAHQALVQLEASHFLYLIQEYEPFTFPMGSYAALAQHTYSLPHVPLFSTELLREYFRAHAIGVYSRGPVAGDASSRAFENAITATDPPSAAELAGRTTRRLLFYARPEAHAARNLFELGILALARVLEDGSLRGGWELRGIGTVDSGRRLALGAYGSIELLPRRGQADYGRLLREHDVGVALMYTPHPSLAPIEMASAGMLTVTNSFENKTPEALARISANLITVEPSVEGIAAGLREAAGRVADYEQRIRGSDVRWSRNWDRSFDERLLAWIESALGLHGCGGGPGEVQTATTLAGSTGTYQGIELPDVQ